MKRFLRNNGLSLTLAAFFLVFWALQGISGFRVNNEERTTHGQQPEAFSEYLAGGHFWQATMENWESEFLQMAAYVFLTKFLFQRGSAESNDPDAPPKDKAENHRDDPDAPAPVRKGGWRLFLYRHSLSLALAAFFLVSFVAHAWGGMKEENSEREAHHLGQLGFGEFISSAKFWFQSMQNWQSEFLAVLAIVVLSIWLREDGSPESKDLWAPHKKTGTE